MSNEATRRWFLRSSAAAGTIAIAGCVSGDDEDDDGDYDGNDGTADTDSDGDDTTAEPGPDATYEIWAADQGTNTIHIYEPGDAEFDHVDEIDTEADGGLVPHMVHYSSDYEYAAVACTAGARTLVYRTEDRELVGNVQTGPGSHFAGFTPDDDAIVVDVIGESTIKKVDADLDDESFEIESTLTIDEEIDGLTEQEGAPICHSYDRDGRSIHTLGPSYHNAGLVIVDHDDFEVDVAFSGEELPTNCGTMPHPEADKFYLTAGLPSDPDEGVDGVGDYYVLDTETDEIITEESTRGADAHGFWYTVDGEELWLLNRETNDGVVVDPDTDDVIEEIDAFGPDQSDNPNERDAPDIMWASPDGEYMFVTLRGPAPLSGDPHAATGVTPGISVLDTETKDIVDVIEPDPIDEYSDEEIAAAQADEDDAPQIPDFHGVGVRLVGDWDGAITSPPF